MESKKMGKYLWVIAVLPFWLSSSVVAAEAKDPVPVTFGGLQIYPVLDVTEEYNTNVFQADTTSVQTSSLISKVSPSLEVGIGSGATYVSVHYQFDKGIHNNAAEADYSDQTATIKGAFEPSKRLRVASSFAYKKDHELRGVAQVAGLQTAVKADKLTKTSLSGHVSYGIRGRIDLDGKYISKRYDDLARGKDVDVDTMGFIAALSFPIRSKGRLSLEGRYTSNNFISNTSTLDNSEQAYFIGVDWDNDSKTTGRVRLGYLSSTYDQLATGGGGVFSWEIDTTWKPISASTLNFNTAYKPVGSNAEYGYVVANENRFSWEHEWSETIKHTTSIGYDFIKYNSDAVAGFPGFQHKETLALASLSVDYKVRRWLKIGGGYSFSNRTSDLPVGGIAKPVYRQHIFSLNLVGTM